MFDVRCWMFSLFIGLDVGRWMFSLFIGFDIRCWMFSLSIRELLIFCDPHQRIKANIEHSTSNVERSQNLGRIPEGFQDSPMRKRKAAPSDWMELLKKARSKRASQRV